MLELMHFPGELRDLEEFRQPMSVAVAKKELEMARSLIASMTEEWNPDGYKDDYREAVEQMIENKIAKGGKSTAPAPARKRASNVIDLVAVLQQSLAAKPGRKAPEPASKAKKKGASARKRA